jgi:hypothetical protein
MNLRRARASVRQRRVQAFTQAPLDVPVCIEIPGRHQVINGKLTLVQQAHKCLSSTWFQTKQCGQMPIHMP